MIVNEQGKTVRDSWDGVNLKFTFCRIVDMMLLNQLDEVIRLQAVCLMLMRMMQSFGSLILLPSTQFSHCML
jgi:hypothetical protein